MLLLQPRRQVKLSVLSVVVLGIKQAECPKRRLILVLADGSYDSQSEGEDGHPETELQDGNLEAFEYEAEDGECELGLNCLAVQAVHHFDMPHMTPATVPSSTEEITCADFDDLLADFDDLQQDSLIEVVANSSKSASISLLAAPCPIYHRHEVTSPAATTQQVVDAIICAPESGDELPLCSLAYLSGTSQPHCSSLQPAFLTSNESTPDHSLVERHVLSTQLVAAEQGQRHNLFQSRCKVKG